MPIPATKPLPGWYVPEDQEATRAAPPKARTAPTAASGADPRPDWLIQMDNERAPTQKSTNPTPHGDPRPDWLVKMDQEEGRGGSLSRPGIDKRPLPSWYTPEPVVAAEPQAHPYLDAANDVAANIATGVLKVPGAIGGIPHLLAHTKNWVDAQGYNAISAMIGDKKRFTGEELDKQDPIASSFPSSEAINNFVEKPPIPDFLTRGFSGPGQFYQPKSVGGRLLQAGVTGAASGGTSIPSAINTGLAATAAEGSNELFPDSPALAALAGLVAHTGASGVGRAARGGGGVAADATRQIFRPTEQGEREAGRALSGVNHAQPGLATPTRAELAAGTDKVRAATDAIGGLPDWQAGANLRAGLQQRVQGLEQARDEATAPLREARDTSPELVNLKPVLNLIDKKLQVAAGAQQDAIKGARNDLHLSDGKLREDGEQLAATRQAINARINDATRAGDKSSAAHLMDVRQALDEQINTAVPAAGEYTRRYADLSQPLDPAQHGAVAKVLDRDQFNSRYVFPEERIPDLFLRSNATRTDLNQLVSAHGGDKDAALGALQDHLAGVAQRAVQPDGTLSTAAFAKAMQPYEKSLGNLGVWFPKLAQKFANAKAAQGTVDTMQAQRGLADAVSNGALRDSAGIVTGASFGRWLRSNQDAIFNTQSPGAVLRLQSIATALQKTNPGELADVLKSEWAPTAAGTMLGGLEGGVLATLLHKSAQTAFGGLDAKRHAAFSAAIERATVDPAYAARLAANAAKRAPSATPIRALVQAIAATPLAVNAAGAGPK